MGRGKCNRQEPRNLEPQKLILEAESYFSRKFAPPKITRYNYGIYISSSLEVVIKQLHNCKHVEPYCQFHLRLKNVCSVRECVVGFALHK